MRPVQGSENAARTVAANQTAEMHETPKTMDSPQGSESKVQNSATDAKSAQQMGQQNKATKNLEGAVRQQQLHSSLPGGDIILAQGKPPSHLTEGPESSETKGNPPSKLRSSKSDPGKMVLAENGIAIFKKGGNHTVYGENKDRIQGNPKDGVNGVYVEDYDGRPQVIIFDKNGKDGTFGRFYPEKFTPQQLVKMWEEERKANPKGTNEEIRQAVVARRNEK
jgi:hypothetical protein